MSKISPRVPTRSFAPLARREVFAHLVSDGRTQDQFRHESDINNIIARYDRSKDPMMLRAPGRDNPQFVDLPDSMDFQAAMIMVSKAESTFSTLPSRVREKYGNDPHTFLAALHDPKEVDFLVKEGLVDPLPLPPQPENIEAPPGPPKATGGSAAV